MADNLSVVVLVKLLCAKQSLATVWETSGFLFLKQNQSRDSSFENLNANPHLLSTCTVYQLLGPKVLSFAHRFSIFIHRYLFLDFNLAATRKYFVF